jgi:hypothetical protein
MTQNDQTSVFREFAAMLEKIHTNRKPSRPKK